MKNAIAILALAADALGAPGVRAQVPQPAALLIENVRIFDGKADRLSVPSNVLVRGNIQTSLGPRSQRLLSAMHR